MYEFEVEQPTTLAQAVEALSSEEAQAIAGGQTLIPTLKARLAMPETLVSLSGIPELRGISQEGDLLTIGATTTHAEIAAGAKSYPGLAALAGGIGDPAVRNRGTIGGSVANNDPSACYPAAVLASGATIVTNAREIPADAFFDGMFNTVLDEGELVTALQFPIPSVSCYMKFEQPASRFALVGVFVANYGGAVRVAVTGASEDGVFRWTEAETALSQEFSTESVERLDVPGRPMLSDIHGSSAYRAHLVKVMTKRAVENAG
ncbi:MAG: FAD binding domain-containing protein [Marinosulfonomonas sp.]